MCLDYVLNFKVASSEHLKNTVKDCNPKHLKQEILNYLETDNVYDIEYQLLSKLIHSAFFNNINQEDNKEK